MIEAIIVLSHCGETRFSRFYRSVNFETQQTTLKESFASIRDRSQHSCSISSESLTAFPDSRIIYRSYSSLYFIAIAHKTENFLSVLDIIHIFVRCLKACLPKITDLCLGNNNDKAHAILDEIIVGGLVAETQPSRVFGALQDIVSVAKNTKDQKIKRKASGGFLGSWVK